MLDRKHKIDEIHLAVNNVEPFASETCSGVIIEWSADIGFGQYTLLRKKDSSGAYQWIAETEHMDSEDDKAFGEALLSLWLKQIQIIE